MKKKIVVSGGDDLLSYIKFLKDDYDIITLMPEVAKALEDADIPNRAFNTFITDQIQAKSSNDVAGVLIQVLTQIPQAVERLHPAIRENFKQIVPGFIMGQGQSLALLINALESANPDGAVVHNDVEPVTRTLALWCKARGKPCVHVPHAIYLDYGRGSVGSDIHDVVTATHLTVSGPFQKQWYMERGFPESNIAMTGVPRFDRLITLPINRERACTVLKLDYRKPTVVYFSSWSQQTNLMGFNDEVQQKYLTFLDAVRGMEDIDVIIKCHPRGGNVKWHTEEAKNRGVRCIVTDQYNDLLSQVMSAGISYGPSNVVISSTVLGKPLGVMCGFENDNEIIKIPTSVDGVRKSLTAMFAMGKPDYSRFLSKYLGVVDGQAAQRVAYFIKQVIQ